MIELKTKENVCLNRRNAEMKRAENIDKKYKQWREEALLFV